jgi:hypothetical protein
MRCGSSSCAFFIKVCPSPATGA